MSGNHTWDLHTRYHLCPKCKTIVESRKNWVKVKGPKGKAHFEKDLVCPVCKHEFKVEKPIKHVSPIFGNPTKPEFDWT